MRVGIFSAIVVLSCQPIMIGNPAAEEGGAAAMDGASGATVANGASNSGVVPSFGGLGNGGASATGGSAHGPNTAGSQVGGTSTAGDAAGGASGTAAGAGEDAGSGGEPETNAEPERVLDARVLFVIYDPTMNGPGGAAQRLSTTLGVEAPDVLAMRLMAQLETLTDGHVHYEVFPFRNSAAFPPLLDGFRYDAAGYQACLEDSSKCSTAMADYDAIELEQELCSAVQDQNPDQIWLLGAEHFGFANQKLSCQVFEDERFVTKTLDLISLDYSRDFPSILYSYQAHALGALQQVFGVSPANATSDAPDNVYGLFVQALGRAPDITASGCGDITFAPNTLEANRFDAPFTMPSYCDSFLHYPRTEAPLAAAVPTTCTAWGCTEVGFRGYWFSHLPRAPWSDSQGKLNDFWRYILYANERLPPSATSVTCSSSYLPGWCQHVTDGHQGVCNENEWATFKKTTGFVEFRFEPKQLVTGVQLYDRACDEQVLSGHLEFSDASADVPFGALEAEGLVPTSMTFEPKLLSGLRVVIDESQGPHPGFGEITVAGSTP